MYKYRKLTQEEKVALVQERLTKGFPPHSPPHPVQNSEFYLITVACYEHKSRISTQQRRQQILNQLFEKLIQEDIEILAWIILPNHYHLLTTNINFKLFSQLLRSIHGPLARQWNFEDKITGKVWFSFNDRAIRDERHYYTTLNYIHYNPVKHNLVASPYNWEESSVHWYLENHGRDWLRNCWIKYPVRNYGKEWDDL